MSMKIDVFECFIEFADEVVPLSHTLSQGRESEEAVGVAQLPLASIVVKEEADFGPLEFVEYLHQHSGNQCVGTVHPRQHFHIRNLPVEIVVLAARGQNRDVPNSREPRDGRQDIVTKRAEEDIGGARIVDVHSMERTTNRRAVGVAMNYADSSLNHGPKPRGLGKGLDSVGNRR